MRWLLPLMLVAGLARADGEPSGTFDYYVLSMSWSPTWCALDGDAQNSPQCDRPLGWILHGLWPQYHNGYPANCPTAERPPSRTMTEGMVDVMGSSGLAWHEWNKHGTCSGLSAQDYFALSRKAFSGVNRPEALRRLADPVTLPATLVEEAFLKANEGWEADMITITCREGRIEEARLCLSRRLEPVPCGQDVVRDCTLGNALLDPVR